MAAPASPQYKQESRRISEESMAENFRVLLSDSLAPQGVEVLKRSQNFNVDVRTGLSPTQLAETIGPYHALIIRSSTRVTREMRLSQMRERFRGVLQRYAV